MSENLHSGHRKRLRKRFIETELEGFHQHEVLEFLLFYSIPRANTNEIGHSLIKNFKSVYEVLNADSEELIKIKGISKKSIEQIKIFGDLCKYYLNSAEVIQKLDDKRDFVNNYFSNIDEEMFLVINIGTNNSIRGTYTFDLDTFIFHKEIIKDLAIKSLKNQTIKILIARCCPKKVRFPVARGDDYRIVKRISENICPLGIEIDDYIISNGSRSFSMREEGAFSFDI